MMKWCFLLVIISVWGSTHQASSGTADVDNSIIIKSEKSGLVFDGNTDVLRAEKPDSSTGQRWTLEASPTGYFVISNVETGEALDVENGCEIGKNIILYEKHSRENQQFYINSDGTIGMACGKKYILKMENGTVEMVTREGNFENGDTVYKIEEAN